MSENKPLLKPAALSKGFINLQDHRYLMMDVGSSSSSSSSHHMNPNTNFDRIQAPQRKTAIQLVERRRRLEYCRSFSQVQTGKGMSRYFTLESMCLLVCLTVSLLILPLILPPLPPPPFLLLLLPIAILVLLMFLALMPANGREAATRGTYV